MIPLCLYDFANEVFHDKIYGRLLDYNIPPLETNLISTGQN